MGQDDWAAGQPGGGAGAGALVLRLPVKKPAGVAVPVIELFLK